MFRNKKSPIFQSTFYTIVTFLFSWAFIIPLIINTDRRNFSSTEISLAFIGGFGPTVGALTSHYVFNGKAETIEWLKKCFNIKIGLLQFLMITLVPGLVVFTIYSSFGFQANNWLKTLVTLSPGMIVNAAFGIFNVGPLGEELGWRGFLTQVLQKKYSTAIVSIIVGIVWSFWHLPFFFIPEFRNNLGFGNYILIYTIGTIFTSYNQIKLLSITKQSVIAAMLFHSVMNTLSGKISDSSLFNIDSLNPGLKSTLLFVPFTMVLIAFVFTVIINTDIFKPKANN